MANFMRVELLGLGGKVQAGNRIDMNARSISRQLAFTLIELIVIIAIVVMLFVLVFSGVRRAREEALRKQCVQNLKQVGLSFRQWTLPSGSVQSFRSEEHTSELQSRFGI